MGAFDYLDPSTLSPTPGKAIVEIVEILGGDTKGGLFIPGHIMDHMGKDTFYGKILKVGPPPALEHYKSGPGVGWDVQPNANGKVWPQKVMDQFQPGDILVLPRDLPLVFVWDDKRYGIVLIHEALVMIKGDSFDPQAFEVVPWKPDEIGGENTTITPFTQQK